MERLIIDRSKINAAFQIASKIFENQLIKDIAT